MKLGVPAQPVKQYASDCRPERNQDKNKPELCQPMHGDLPSDGLRWFPSPQLYAGPKGSSSSRASIFWKEGVCLVARASVPRILQLSVGRIRGEAVGRIQTLIGTPERFFYTGMPPTVLGGLYPLLVFIRPLLVWRGGLAFPPQVLYSTPLGYMSRKKVRGTYKSYER